MIQQTFPVTIYRPRVIITNVHGHLNVQPWTRQEIYIEVSGEVGMLKQEGETLVVADCQRDLVLRIPSITELVSTVTTDVIVNNLWQGASITSAGNVILADVDGDILLQDIHGDAELTNVNGVANVTNVGGSLQAMHVPHLDTRYIGGNAILSDTAQVNL